jgi:hypothetical protein
VRRRGRPSVPSVHRVGSSSRQVTRQVAMGTAGIARLASLAPHTHTQVSKTRKRGTETRDSEERERGGINSKATAFGSSPPDHVTGPACSKSVQRTAARAPTPRYGDTPAATTESGLFLCQAKIALLVASRPLTGVFGLTSNSETQQRAATFPCPLSFPALFYLSQFPPLA